MNWKLITESMLPLDHPWCKILIFPALLFCTSSSFCQKTYISIVDGKWFSLIPTIWSCSPLPCTFPFPINANDTVIINHNVILDTNWAIGSFGSVTVNAGASLIEDKDGRIMAVNGGKLINYGTVAISNLFSIGGMVENDDSMRISLALYNSTLFFNNGILAKVDSFANEGVFKNSPGAKLAANLFLNTDSCINNGVIITVDCENDGVFINRRIVGSINLYNAKTGVFNNDSGGAVSTAYFWNVGNFNNYSGSKINTSFDFLNGDSLPLSLNSTFYNDGFAGIGNDWYNTETIDGYNGQFCVDGYTYNSGIMSGTFDFCDNSPPLVIPPSPVIDFYTDIANIDTMITYCLYSCEMVVSFEYGEPSCFGNCDGYARATVFGGVPPYSFIWWDTNIWSDTIATTDSVGGLCNGIYRVQVIDSISDTLYASKLLFTPLLEVSKDSTSATCGLPNGTATVTVNNGNFPFTYLWNDPGLQTDSTATGLAAGAYSVTVTDDMGCMSIRNIDVLALPDILFSILVTNASCPDSANGLAAATVSGGTPPFTYLWEPGAKSASTAINLLPGTYYLTITDSANCIKKDTIGIGVKDTSKCAEWHIFSGITPNNDGVDDRWIIKGLNNYKPVSVFIFNSRGLLVWQSGDYNNDWDGTNYKGTALPEGIYYYVVNRADKTQKGWVSILR